MLKYSPRIILGLNENTASLKQTYEKKTLTPGSQYKPLNYHEWPIQNFFLQDQYNTKQTSDKNKKEY